MLLARRGSVMHGSVAFPLATKAGTRPTIRITQYAMQSEPGEQLSNALSTLADTGLGDFLRKRRRRLSAEECGLRTASRRRTPGLRREDVAELAGISSAWYANLEARRVQPSTSTLLAVAMALRLSDAETDYLFELAGLTAPLRYRDPAPPIPPALRSLVATTPYAASLFDCYFTPVLWNAVAGALFGIDTAAPDFERNFIVRGLTDETFVALFGPDFEAIAMRTVGTFRRALATHRPTPLARRVYEFASRYEVFRRGWSEEAIVVGITARSAFERHHHIVGSIRVESIDLRTGANNDAILRILTPADADSETKFATLSAMGTAFVG
jgi:transcriptional regulator with XRE-family HTH domain